MPPDFQTHYGAGSRPPICSRHSAASVATPFSGGTHHQGTGAARRHPRRMQQGHRPLRATRTVAERAGAPRPFPDCHEPISRHCCIQRRRQRGREIRALGAGASASQGASANCVAAAHGDLQRCCGRLRCWARARLAEGIGNVRPNVQLDARTQPDHVHSRPWRFRARAGLGQLLRFIADVREERPRGERVRLFCGHKRVLWR
mmetsp:Transcript_113427/g.321006  ORF Transcript_113427/g.321006 Transcript_113427/m.321006 type:complete len:203 (+) Transcript_113427:33-641(+)